MTSVCSEEYRELTHLSQAKQLCITKFVVTNKMIMTIEDLALKLDRQLPIDYKTNYAVTNRLIGEWIAESTALNQERPEIFSAKQIYIVERFAPEEILELIDKDYKIVKAWIDSFLKEHTRREGGRCHL
jgi:hypothetical protein